MSTQITVTVDRGGLLQRNKQQTSANRQALLEQEVQKQVEQQATEQLDAVAAEDALGKYKTAGRLKEEPAAFRRGGGDPLFGYIDISNVASTFDKISEPDFWSKQSKITGPSNFIKPPKKAKELSVVRVIIIDSEDSLPFCPHISKPEPSQYFAGCEEKLQKFIDLGGVVWINNEYSTCGIPVGPLNSYLNNLFSCTLYFNDDIVEEPDRVSVTGFIEDLSVCSLAYQGLAKYSPDSYYTAATGSISGGTALYTLSGKTVCAFEKIGNGYLVLSGDSNGTSSSPVAGYDKVTFLTLLQNLDKGT